jgi:phosphatidylcholine synthase
MGLKIQLSNAQFCRSRAWGAHLYTGMGLIAGFLALGAIIAGNAQRCVPWLGLALFIDATDGTLARACDVKRWTPQFDGRKLDDIIDYLNYTFIPVAFAYRFGLVAGLGGQIVLGLVLILSAYGFCQQAAKTDDGFFLILYLYVLHFPPDINTAILLLFAILVLVPFKYITHHTAPFHRLTMIILGLFWVTLIALGATLNRTPPWLIWISLLGPAYYIGMSAYLQSARRRQQG